MWGWLLTFFALPAAADAPKPNPYIGRMAAEAAYSAMIPSAPVEKPKVPTSECKTCNGTGRVRSGDGHEWTKCPDCDPSLDGLKTPKSDPLRYR